MIIIIKIIIRFVKRQNVERLPWRYGCDEHFLSVQCNSWHWTDIKSLECLSVCLCVCLCVRKTFRPR